MSENPHYTDFVSASGEPVATSEHETRPLVEKLDEKRAVTGTWLFILSEALLFLLLFFSYYYTAKGQMRWRVEDPPSLKFVLPMLVILLTSSAVLHFGERQVKRENYAAGRIAAGITILLGLVFLALSFFDYREEMKHLLPTSNAYGSNLYTITSLHLAHLFLGLMMLLYVMVLPRLEPTTRPPHKPYHCASLYWHFVDTVWVFIVTLLYVVPHLRA